MAVRHHGTERLHHADIGPECAQGIQQRRHQRDHKEDVEQLFGGHEAGAEDAAESRNGIAVPCERDEEGGDDRRHHDVEAQDHGEHDRRDAEQIGPMCQADPDMLHELIPRVRLAQQKPATDFVYAYQFRRNLESRGRAHAFALTEGSRSLILHAIKPFPRFAPAQRGHLADLATLRARLTSSVKCIHFAHSKSFRPGRSVHALHTRSRQ